MPCGCARGQEVRTDVGRYGQGKLVDIQLHQGHTQKRRVRQPDRIEGHINTAGFLDTTMSGQIMDLLMGINAAGTTILMVTHNPELAQRVHRQFHIVDGRIDQIHQFKPVQPLPAVTSAAV